MYSTGELKKLYTNEEVLVVLLCRLYFKKTDVKEIQSLISSGVIDHEKLFTIVSAHGIRPLVYSIITEHDLDLHASFIEKLKAYSEANQVHSFEKLLWLKKLSDQFRNEGIDAIPLKGILFSAEYYGNLSLRESSDIDFLISPCDVDTIEAIIQRQGFKEKMTVPGTFMPYYKKHFKEIVYVIPSAQRKRGYTLEIHWRLLNKYMGNFPSHDFLKNGTRQYATHNFTFEKLSPSYDFLTLISNHFIKDLSVKFKYLVDVAAIIHQQGNSLDVDLIKRIIEETKCHKRTALGLSLLNNLLGVQLKGWDYSPSFDNIYAKQVLQVPLVLHRFLILDPVFIKRSLRLQDNTTEKRKFLYRCFEYFLLPTHNDINLFSKLPLSLLFLLRPFRLAGKQMKKVIGL